MCSQSLISIVTPSFNQGAFLEETLCSVVRQDYPHTEHIVIDGGSTDGSVEIIRKHEAHLACWITEPDGGQSAAINKGFAKATGEIFAWLNSDDLLAPSAIRIAVEYLDRDPHVGVVYGDRLHIDSKGNVIGINRCPSHDPRMFRHDVTLPQETVFFRRWVWEQVGGLDESLHFAMDLDLWIRMSRICAMRHIPAYLGYFRAHEAAKSVIYHDGDNPVSSRYEQEHRLIFQRHFGCSPPSPWRSKWYRYRRYLRGEMNRRTASYQNEALEIRQIMVAGPAAQDRAAWRGANG